MVKTTIINPVFKINDDDYNKCAICLENILSDKIIQLDCNHQFHFDCLKKITNNKCPLCRDEIIKEEICNGCVSQNFFYVGFVKKNGNCIHCGKKSYNYILKQKII